MIAAAAGARRARASIAVKRLLWAMLLAVAIYAGFAVWRGVGKLGDELVHFGWWAFGVACALALTNYLLRWFKWQLRNTESRWPARPPSSSPSG